MSIAGEPGKVERVVARVAVSHVHVIVIEEVAHAGVLELEVAVLLGLLVQLSAGVEGFGPELLEDDPAAVNAVELALGLPSGDVLAGELVIREIDLARLRDRPFDVRTP